MKISEIASLWPFQEIFVDPDFVLSGGKTVGVTLNLKKSISHKREENRLIVTVEIFASLTVKNCQIANVRFVNVSHFKGSFKGKKLSGLLDKIAFEKVNEFLSFLPIYLVKSGIFIETIEWEKEAK